MQQKSIKSLKRRARIIKNAKKAQKSRLGVLES
jgi:hypothetical protein